MNVVKARLQVNKAVSAATRPVTMEISRMGRLRNRSKRPPWRSSAMPVAAPMPEKRTLVTTNPGMTKST